MNLENIKKFIDLAKSEDVSELKYEEKDFKISVNFSKGSSSFVQPQLSCASSTSAVGEDKAQGLHEVTSPFVGTYYTQPSPGKPAYVRVGDRVKPGQTLCILEAMKIMNEIESDVSGEIIEICNESESLVEFGQTLFKIRV